MGSMFYFMYHWNQLYFVAHPGDCAVALFVFTVCEKDNKKIWNESTREKKKKSNPTCLH